jgi:kynurenine formamidase
VHEEGLNIMTALPTEEEWAGYFDSLSNWGRWGDDDRLGTLNLITPESRKQAASLVQDGRTVSLSRDMDPGTPDPLTRGTILQRFMQYVHVGESEEDGSDFRYRGVREYVGLIPHGSHTHLDGLAHISWKGMNYNGFPASDTDSVKGAVSLSVHHASSGIIGRGVLLDIPALTGREWLEPGETVGPDQLEEAEARQGVKVREGDILLMYTGNFKRIAREGLHPQLHHPGYSAACLPWLHDRDVSLISSDNINDALPSGYNRHDMSIPVHCVALVAMGLWMVDNMMLDELAETCHELGRWEFMFSMLPWRCVGVTASPVNPVAIF